MIYEYGNANSERKTLSQLHYSKHTAEPVKPLLGFVAGRTA